MLHKIMDNEIYSEVTIAPVDKMIYRAVYEIWYSLSKRPDEKIILFCERILRW